MSATPATNSAAAPLLTRVASADAADAARLAGAIQDLALPAAARLDERTRDGVQELFAALVTLVEREVAGNAATLLSSRVADALARTSNATLARLLDSGMLRYPTLTAELLGRVRQEQLAEALPRAVSDGERPSLLARLLACPDISVAGAARALLIADNRRRGVPVGTELPAELHHQLVWAVAAALRAEFAADEALDHALTVAARRSLAAHDEGDRAEAAALRLAAAIDASPAELADLLLDALGDGRAILFIAALAHAGGLDYETARTIVLDPAGDRLWLALRAADLSRETIAQIAFALAEADHARDLDAVAEELDAIAALAPDTARAALAPLRRDRDLRAALHRLGKR